MVRVLALTLVLALGAGRTAVSAADGGGTGSPLPGYLAGRVRLGPFCPVEAKDVPCPVPSGAYASREIWVSRGGEIVARAPLDASGHFRIPLAPGPYTVDINRAGMDASGDVPKEVQIRSGETRQLDIAIDTGIR